MKINPFYTGEKYLIVNYETNTAIQSSYDIETAERDCNICNEQEKRNNRTEKYIFVLREIFTGNYYKY